MFESLFNLAVDAVKIVDAVVSVPVTVVRVATKPLGDLAEAAKEELKNLHRDLTG